VLAAFLAGTIATARGKHGREAYRRLEGKLPRDLGAGAGSNGNHSPGVHFLNFPDKEINELGARGIGEIGLAGFAAAMTAAVHHATGVRVRELPIKIEDLLA